jgi:hypothetical protein
MGYLDNFEHDIFFSYAHGPESNVSVSPEDDRYLQRWTQRLAHDVVQYIHFYLRQKDTTAEVRGWIDRSLARTETVDKTLEDQVRNSGLFFCVMTNFYLASPYCIKEIEWFKDTYADEGDNRQRIFVIRATRTERKDWPKALKAPGGSTVGGYKFYENTEANQEFFDPFGWPVPQPGDQKYWQAVRNVALDAAKKLWALKKAERGDPDVAASPIGPDTSLAVVSPAGPEVGSPVNLAATSPVNPAATSPVDPAAGSPVDPAATSPINPAATSPVSPAATSPVSPGSQKIFLGLMHDTLFKVRDDIRSKLRELGFSVVPDLENEPYDQTSLDKQLASLGECQAAVLVANEYCGRWPQNEPGGFVSYQLDAFQRAKVPVHSWIHVRDIERAQTADYKKYLEKLLSEGGMRFANVNEFCHSFAQIRGSIAGIEFALLVTNKPSEDKQYAEFQDAVTAAISDSGRLILTSNMSSTSEAIRLTDLDASLSTADTLAIICFDQKWAWASQLMAQLRQLRSGNNQKRHQLLVTGPVATQPLILDARTLSFETVDGAGVDLPALKTTISQKLLTPIAR